MIQQQSAALSYCSELLSSLYTKGKDLLLNSSYNLAVKIKQKIIMAILATKNYLIEFLFKDKLENEKIRKHIKILDTMLMICLVSSAGGLFLKLYSQ